MIPFDVTVRRMSPDDCQSPAAGRVLQTPQGYAAFVLALLPPGIVYDGELMPTLFRAGTALSELSGAGRMLPNPRLLLGSYIRYAAIQSSYFEGKRTDLEELLLSNLTRAEVNDEAIQ
jgi:hypothetical protein